MPRFVTKISKEKGGRAIKVISKSVLAKILLLNIIFLFIFSYIYSITEKISFLDALFYSFINLFTEFSQNPTTVWGKLSSLAVMGAGILLFALIVGEFSKYLIEQLVNRDKIKLKDYYDGRNHIVILGLNSKIDGILRELRSKALDISSRFPIVIVSPKVDTLSIIDDVRKKVYGIKGEVLDFNAFKRARLERARSILVLSEETNPEAKRLYRDAETTLVYTTVCDYLCLEENANRVKRDMNIVIEYLDSEINLLPSCRETSPELEVYHEQIGESGKYLIVEPIFMEKMPAYLFAQAILEKDINEIVQRLVTAQHVDTNEFYYVTAPSEIIGKSFYVVEKALLDTNAIPIGILRKSKIQFSEQYEEGMGDYISRIRLIINPADEVLLQEGDLIVLISYTEKDGKKAAEKLKKPLPVFQPKKLLVKKFERVMFIPFKKIIILNWNKHQIQDIVTEIAKLCMHKKSCLKPGDFTKIQITILSKLDIKTVKPMLDEIKRDISSKLPEDIDSLLDIKIKKCGDPMDLVTLKEVGVVTENRDNIRVIVLSGEGKDGDSDRKALYYIQLIENKVSDKIFTAVELMHSKSYDFFRNTRADVTISIDDFSEKLLAQAVLKRYVSLIFRNLLTFSEGTNEFYIRKVPDSFVEKKIIDFQEALIGHPVIFLGHIRQAKSWDGVQSSVCCLKRGDTKDAITINPKIEGEYKESSIMYDRVKKTDRFEEGDRVILIARKPEIVDTMIATIK